MLAGAGEHPLLLNGTGLNVNESAALVGLTAVSGHAVSDNEAEGKVYGGGNDHKLRSHVSVKGI